MSFAWAALSYLLFGTHLWLLVLSTPGTGLSDLAPCTGTIATAMIAGLFILVMPSGLGVRELVMFAQEFSLARERLWPSRQCPGLC